MTPLGPFDLANQNRYFNPWPTLPHDPGAVVMAFPLEGWTGSAAVVLRQHDGGDVDVQVVGAGSAAGRAAAQALASISLDVDGRDWPAIGERTPWLAAAQTRHGFLRPSMFHSPYEAAAGFVIGHRISIVQTRRIRARMAEGLGDVLEVEGTPFAAFPAPEVLLGLSHIDGLADSKIDRLHGVARAALDGLLDRAHLRALAEAEAIAELLTIPGIGPFFAEAILYRAVGVPTGMTHDPMSLEAVRRAFGLVADPTPAEAARLTEQWQPLRMWALVLAHVELRGEQDPAQVTAGGAPATSRPGTG